MRPAHVVTASHEVLCWRHWTPTRPARLVHSTEQEHMLRTLGAIELIAPGEPLCERCRHEKRELERCV